MKKVLKSELAHRYGIYTKAMVSWIKHICPEEIRIKHVGVKTKMIRPFDAYRFFGKPEDRPMTSSCKLVLCKEDFVYALDISYSILKRRLKNLEVHTR